MTAARCLALILLSAQAWAGADVAPDNLLPGTFFGSLPCADCPGVDYHLELFEDGAYYFRITYPGREEAPLDDIGTWVRSSDGRVLALHGGREAPVMFAIAGPDTLDRLDHDGRPVVSAQNQSLARTEGLAPLEPSLPMRGMFRYFADGAVFQECLTGRRMPVTMDGDYLRLEQAYLQARRAPDDALLASLRGRIVERAGMEGPARPTLVVEVFSGVWPGESCGTRFASAELHETYWRLTQLDGEPVFVSPGGREPHMVLREGEAASVHGSTGCNRFTGQFEREGTSLRFGTLAATMMACADTMAQETSFTRALDATRSWRIIGQHLELSDEEGRLRARFEAVYLR